MSVHVFTVPLQHFEIWHCNYLYVLFFLYFLFLWFGTQFGISIMIRYHNFIITNNIIAMSFLLYNVTTQ